MTPNSYNPTNSAGTYWRNRGGSYKTLDPRCHSAAVWDLDNPSRYTATMGFRTSLPGRMPR